MTEMTDSGWDRMAGQKPWGLLLKVWGGLALWYAVVAKFVPGLVLILLANHGIAPVRVAHGWGGLLVLTWTAAAYGAGAWLAWRVGAGRVPWADTWDWRMASQGAALGVLLAALGAGLVGLVQGWPQLVRDVGNPHWGPNPAIWVAWAMYLMVLMPITQEWLYRGAMQTSLTAVLGPIPAMIGMAIGLTLMSHPTRLDWMLLAAGTLGMGFVRHRTTSVSATIGIRMGIAAVLVAVTALGVRLG